MHTRYLLKSAITGLVTHKSRTALTILGIVIGITSIILVMSLGQGAQDLILKQVQSIGSKTIAVVPGRQPSGPTDALSTFTDSLKNRDLDSLMNKGNVPHLASAMPVVFGSESIAAGSETYRGTILGVTPQFADIYNVFPAEPGRNFTDDEVKGYATVAIIGDKVREELFGGSSALNQKVRIKGVNLRVVGVFPKTGQLSFLNIDEAVVLPYTTAQQSIFGIKYFNRLVLEADNVDNLDVTVEDVKMTLRNNHNITDPAKDDFFIQTQADAVKTVSTITNVLTIFLTAIASIALVVGGVGIMNIMLVSVTERTHEIGLRKALGATNRNILSQFLIEAVLLTFTGGVVGILLGGAFAFLISLVLSRAYGLDWGFILPLSAVLLGLGVSSGIGLVFGIYPARQAAKKSPIEALRYE